MLQPEAAEFWSTDIFNSALVAQLNANPPAVDAAKVGAPGHALHPCAWWGEGGQLSTQSTVAAPSGREALTKLLLSDAANASP